MDRVSASLPRRYRAERRFRAYGVLSVLAGILFLVILLASIFAKGYTAFRQTFVTLDVYLDSTVIDPQGSRDQETLRFANYNTLIRSALQEIFPEVSGRSDKRKLAALVSNGAPFQLQDMVLKDTALIGQTITVEFPASADVDMLVKGKIDRSVPEEQRRISDAQIGWIDALQAQGRLHKRWNRTVLGTNQSTR